MRRFLRYSLFYLMPVMVLLVVLEVLLRRIPNDYSFKNERVTQDGRDMSFIILGNSHAYKGIEPDTMGAGGFNLANISQDLRYDRAILERYLPALPNLRSIVLTISYGSLGAQLEQGREAWRVKNYGLYMDIDDHATTLEHRLELLNRPMREQVAMIGESWNGVDNRICSNSGAGHQQPKEDLDLDRSGKEAAARHRRTSARSIEQSRAELDRIVQLAKERGIRLHLITAPAWRSYRDALEPQQLNSVIGYCKALDERGSLVDYHNFMDDPRFVQADFADADHLSVQGQNKFSRILGDLIGTRPTGHGVERAAGTGN